MPASNLREKLWRSHMASVTPQLASSPRKRQAARSGSSLKTRCGALDNSVHPHFSHPSRREMPPNPDRQIFALDWKMRPDRTRRQRKHNTAFPITDILKILYLNGFGLHLRHSKLNRSGRARMWREHCLPRHEEIATILKGRSPPSPFAFPLPTGRRSIHQRRPLRSVLRQSFELFPVCRRATNKPD